MKTTHLSYLLVWLFAFGLAPCVYGEPEIDVVPLSYDFGGVEVGSSATVEITIYNNGDSPITIHNATFKDGSSGDYSITSLFWPPVFFTAGGMFKLEITFAPSSGGGSGAILEIASSDSDEPLVEVVLTGEGTGGEVTPLEQIEEINDFSQVSVDDGTLVGTGRGKSAGNRLRTFVKKLQKVESLIEEESYEDACDLLKSVYKHADGLGRPKDFVEGVAREELAAKIEELIAALDCD